MYGSGTARKAQSARPWKKTYHLYIGITNTIKQIIVNHNVELTIIMIISLLILLIILLLLLIIIIVIVMIIYTYIIIIIIIII